MAVTGALAAPQTTPPLASLGEREQRVLSYAAAMGKEFRFDVLALVTEMEEEALAEVLEGLVHRGVVRELAGGDVYVFVREEMLGQAYRSISSSRLRVIHKKIAEGYEKVYSANPPQEVIAEMGRHFHLGKVADRSLLYNRYAATLARGSFSPETAKAYLERVVEDLRGLPGDHRTEQADVLREVGEIHLSMGEAVEADGLFNQCLSLLPPDEPVLRALVLLSRAETARMTDKLSLTHRWCDEAIALLDKAGHRRGLAMAHRLLSRAAFKEGSYENGKKEIEAALALLDPTEDTKEVARAYIDLGNAYTNRMDDEALGLAVAAYRKAIASLAALQDYRELCRAHTNLAVAIGNSDPATAVAELREAQAAGRKAGDRRSVGWAQFNSVEFLLEMGEVREAEEANAQAAAVLEKIDDPMGVQQVTLNRAILAQHRGALAEAEKIFRQALHLAEDLGYESLVAEMHLRLSVLYLAMGREKDAQGEFALTESLGGEPVLSYARPLYRSTKERLGRTGR